MLYVAVGRTWYIHAPVRRAFQLVWSAGWRRVVRVCSRHGHILVPCRRGRGAECEWLGPDSEGVFHFRVLLGPPEKVVELFFQNESEGKRFGDVVKYIVDELRRAKHANAQSSSPDVDIMEPLSQAGKQCPPDRLSSFTFVLFHYPGSKA